MVLIDHLELLHFQAMLVLSWFVVLLDSLLDQRTQTKMVPKDRNYWMDLVDQNL